MPQVRQAQSFEEKAAALEAAMRAAGYPVVRTSGTRSADQQAKLYAQGRTLPGKRVTGKSGAPGDESAHQLNAASDFAFVGADGQPSWDDTHPWDLLGSQAQALGLEWGGNWKQVDRPHVQERRVAAPSMNADQAPAAPAAPAAPQRKYSYRELVDAWKTEYPGEFDDFDNSDILEAVFAEVPEFRGLVDESTRGTESVAPPNLGGYEKGPKLPGPPPLSALPAPSNVRTPGLGDMVVEAGLVAVPSVVGAVVGNVPGAVAGGMLGEAAREGYQQWSGTRNDGLSIPNIAVQGALNAVPVAKYAGKAIGAVAPTLAGRVAPSVARVAGATLEGAMGSAASTGAEAMIRDNRLPELGELGMSAALGAPFGAAVGGGAEIFSAIKAGRAVPDPAHVDQMFAALASPDPAGRNAAAQAVYEMADAVGQHNPAAGAAMLQRLVVEADAITQVELQTFAGAFVQDFGKRADTLTMDAQISEVEQFLSGLKERGAGPDVLRTANDILTTIRDTSSPRPIDQPSTTGWYSPVEPLPAQQELGIQKSPLGMRDGPPLATVDPAAQAAPPTLQAQGIDMLPGVQAGAVARDEAVMMNWLMNDLTEHGFVQGTAQRVTDTEFRPDDPLLENATNIFTPHAAGTPVLKMFNALGVNMTRSAIANQIDNLLQGKARRPGKAALAAQRISRAMNEAWVPADRRFDWSLVSDDTLQAVGLRMRRDFQTPMSPLSFHMEGQPADLVERYLPGEQARLAAMDAPALAATRPEDFAPDEIAEARKLVRTASDTELRQLYDDLTTYGGGAENLEAPEDFGGAWYDVGPGIIGAELERRGLGKYSQPSLATEGPGTPGKLPVQGETPTRAPQLEEQPELIEGVRTTERPTPLLMKEAELFRLTPESQTALEAPRRAIKAPSLFGDETGAAGKVGSAKTTRQAALRDVKISAEHMDDLKQTVQAAGDEEVAGILVGDADGNIQRVILSDNRAADPTKTFEIGADVVQRAQLFARQRGWEVLASFHSQPTGSAEPSKRDLKGNVADLPMLIIGARGGSMRDVKIWQPSGTKTAPWLEGSVTVADAPVVPGTMVPPKVADWAVDRIPKFTGAPGDTPAMVDYLKSHKAEFSTEPWYVRTQQFVDEGNPRMAWVELQAATLATQKATRALAQATPTTDAHRAALLDRIERATAAGPQDPVGALFALYDGRTTWVPDVGRVVIAPEIPAPLKGKGVTVGPGGILHPGKATIDLPIAQQSISMTVDAVNSILRDTSPGLILDDPTNASATRLMHQVAEQLLRRSPSQYAAERAWSEAMLRQGVSQREINRQVAAHYTQSLSDAGKLLGATGLWRQRHDADIRRIEGITGASGEIDDVLLIGAGGRKLGRLGDLAPIDVYKDIIAPGRAWDRAMLLNDLTRKERGAFDTFESASRGFMLSQWATAMRNTYSATGRWGLEMIADVGTAVGHTISGRPATAIKSLQRATDMLRYTPVLRPGGWVMPWHAKQAQWEQVFTTTGFLAGFKGKERLAIEKLIQGLPEEQAYFLGGTSLGEPHPHGQSKYRFLNWLASPRVQNTLTMFNRSSDFTVRADLTVINFRDALRQRGIDPDLLWQLPPADLTAKLGGPEELQRAMHHSIGGALDFTFSGETITRGFGIDAKGKPIGAFNSLIIKAINSIPGVRAGYPFPRFNFSAAPRLMWDYSGVNAIVESLNQVLLETQGTTLGKVVRGGLVAGGYATGGLPGAAVAGGIVARGGVPLSLTGRTAGRFELGRRAAKLATETIPGVQTAYLDAQARMGEQLQIVQALSREHTVRRRLITRAERRGLQQQATAGRKQLEPLDRALDQAMDAFKTAEAQTKDLHAQRTSHQATVDQAKAVRAPQSYAELWGRAGAGMVAMLGPALLIRADQHDKGTKAHDLRYDLPGLGDTIIDTRAFAPLPQVLFVADVINDLDIETNWPGVWEDVEAGIPFTEALYARYEGKYTAATLGKELLNAFLSMSQKAGTSLAVIDEVMALGERGVDTKRLGNAMVSAIGNLLARYTIPFAPLKQLAAGVVPEEGDVRIADIDAGWAAPLMQYTANLPFLGSKIIPEKYNQVSGQPLSAHMPWLRALLGITTRKWDRVAGEINATGVPGSAVYILATNDIFLDRLIAGHYARAISQHADSMIFANEYYQTLDSPATRRDYLQTYVFPNLKKIALGAAMIDVGWKRMKEEREGPEQRRRRLRTERLYGLAGEEGISFKENAEEPEEPDVPESEPDDSGTEAPPAAPGSVPPSPQSPQAYNDLRAPAFDEEQDRQRPAFDRVLAPAFPA